MMVTTIEKDERMSKRRPRNVELTDVGTGVLIIPDPVTELSFGNLDVILLRTVGLDQLEKVVIDVRELILSTGDVGNVHVVGGRTQVFELLSGENVDGNQVDLGVSVLAGLRGAHLDDLAGTTLDDDVSVEVELLSASLNHHR